MRILCALAAMVFAVFLAQSALAVDLVFSDDFNNRNIGDWTITTSADSSYVEVSPTISKEGEGSLHFFSDKSATNLAYAESPQIDFSSLGIYNISFYFMAPAQSLEPYQKSHWYKAMYNGFVNLVWDNGAASVQQKIVCRQDGSGSVNKVVSPSLSGDTWYKFEVEVHPESSLYYVFVDNQFQGSCRKYSDHTNKILVGDDSANSMAFDFGEAYLDFIEVNIPADTTPPAITVLSPLNTSINNRNFMANISLNENAASCKVSIDSGDQQDMSISSSAKSWSANLTVANDGSHSTKFSCADSKNNVGENSVIFTIDTITPSMNVSYPKNVTYAEDFVWLNVTTSEPAFCKYRIDDTVPSPNNLNTNDNTTFFKKIENLTGSHRINMRCSDPAENIVDSPEIFFTTNATLVSSDVESDSTEESAQNSDGIAENGFENYNDPNNNTNVVNTTDGDGDGRIDFFLNTTGGPEPEIYWDPDNAINSTVSLADVNSDGIIDFVFDLNGDGTNDKWYNPVSGSVEIYTPPAPPSTPQNPVNPGGPGGGSAGGDDGSGGGTPPRGVSKIIFVNPPTLISGEVEKEIKIIVPVKNVGNYEEDVSLKIDGIPEDWYSYKTLTLKSGESGDFEITLKPKDEFSGEIKLFGLVGNTNSSFASTLEVKKAQEIVPATTTTTTIPKTTTTTTPPTGGITGLVTFATSNPAVVGTAAIITIISGSVLWSLRKEKMVSLRREKAKAAENSKETPAA